MKVKAQTKDLVVIDLRPDKELIFVDDAEFSPETLRVFADRIEMVCGYESERRNNTKKKKTLKFYFGDMVIFNRALHRVTRPRQT